MIACDNTACPVGWYHLNGLKLKKVPTGKRLSEMPCSDTMFEAYKVINKKF